MKKNNNKKIKKAHNVYIWEDLPNNEMAFVMIAKIPQEANEETNIGAIVCTVRGRKVITVKYTKNIKKKILIAVDLNPICSLKEIKDISIRQHLLEMEDKEIKTRKRYKFGVLFAKENQSESDMFCNGSFLLSINNNIINFINNIIIIIQSIYFNKNQNLSQSKIILIIIIIITIIIIIIINNN